MINEFVGKYRFLSNFDDKEVTYKGLTFLNSEACFQAQKSLTETGKSVFTIMNPSDAKKLGRKVKLRKDWEKVKADIMLEIVRAKFSQNKDIAKKLLDTGDQDLTEGNTWHDNYFGVCSCDRCINETKRNVLGKVLMIVRKELREKGGVTGSKL